MPFFPEYRLLYNFFELQPKMKKGVKKGQFLPKSKAIGLPFLQKIAYFQLSWTATKNEKGREEGTILAKK